jgi:predicted RNA-binding protein Jag
MDALIEHVLKQLGKSPEEFEADIKREKEKVQVDPDSPQAKLLQLEEENNLLKMQNQAITERSNFLEDVIAEMAMEVYK